jgi:hypothetical protein
MRMLRLSPFESHGAAEPPILAANGLPGYGAINSVAARVLHRDFTIRVNGARPS